METDPFVLIVDDDETIRNLIKDTLVDGGFATRVTSSGEEAIALLNTQTCRVLIIDVSLGHDRVKGWPVARHGRAFNPDLPVIYITGGSTEEWSVHGVPRSVLLTKPFAPAQLLTAVSELLNAK
jgi:DNA-binding response OmpR family regulator